MSQDIDIVYEVLDKEVHDRDTFNCKEEALNDFITSKANKGQKERNSTTHVAVELNVPSPKIIYGFYTLTHTILSYDIFPDKKLIKPKYAIRFLPEQEALISIKIARLARNEFYTEPGFGEYLLIDALRRITRESRSFAGGIHVVDIDAKNESLKEYYRKFGFMEFKHKTNSMFIDMKTIEKLHGK